MRRNSRVGSDPRQPTILRTATFELSNLINFGTPPRKYCLAGAPAMKGTLQAFLKTLRAFDRKNLKVTHVAVPQELLTAIKQSGYCHGGRETQETPIGKSQRPEQDCGTDFVKGQRTGQLPTPK